MPRLSDILAHTAELPVHVAGTTILVTYRPSVYSSAFLAGLAEMSATDALAQLLVGWDLADDAGEPIPITEECLASMPLIVLQAVSEAVSEALLPNSPTRKRSGSRS